MRWISIKDWKKKHGIGKIEVKKRVKEVPVKKVDPVFKLVGYDTFSHEWYGLSEFPTEKQARDAGIKRLELLAISQPAASSGGQSGIQDQVYIQYPDGKRFRVIG